MGDGAQRQQQPAYGRFFYRRRRRRARVEQRATGCGGVGVGGGAAGHLGGVGFAHRQIHDVRVSGGHGAPAAHSGHGHHGGRRAWRAGSGGALARSVRVRAPAPTAGGVPPSSQRARGVAGVAGDGAGACPPSPAAWSSWPAPCSRGRARWVTVARLATRTDPAPSPGAVSDGDGAGPVSPAGAAVVGGGAGAGYLMPQPEHDSRVLRVALVRRSAPHSGQLTVRSGGRGGVGISAGHGRRRHHGAARCARSPHTSRRRVRGRPARAGSAPTRTGGRCRSGWCGSMAPTMTPAPSHTVSRRHRARYLAATNSAGSSRVTPVTPAPRRLTPVYR